MFYLLALIIKSESSLIQKTNILRAMRNWQILYYEHWVGMLGELKSKF